MSGFLKPLELSENDIRKACLDLLASRNWYVHRVWCGPFWTYSKVQVLQGAPNGTPDYLCVHSRYPGFFLETKRPRGELQPVQQATRRTLELGYRLAVVKVDDPRVLREFLDQHEGKYK